MECTTLHGKFIFHADYIWYINIFCIFSTKMSSRHIVGNIEGCNNLEVYSRFIAVSK